MKKIINFFVNPIVISVIGLILVSLLIWFVGPAIKFGENNYAPLAGAVSRLILIMVIVLAWGANNLRVQMRDNKSNQNLVESIEESQSQNLDGQSAEEVHQLSQRFSQAMETLKKLRFSGVGKKKALYELPWYIIVGPPGSGKTTALVNSGLEFPLAEKFGKGALQGVGGTRNCDWWFTNSAVLIDTAGRYTTQDSHRVVDSSAWEGFLNLLKRHRRRRPINGAIVAISLQDLLTQSEEERALHAKTIRTRLDELMEKLEIRFPIYLMFTKVDLVSGFREFFENLGKEEREQVWGVSFPNAPNPQESPDFEFYTKQFSALVSRLYERVLWQVHQERNIQNRASVYAFPQEMENLKSIADSFVRQTFVANRYKFQPYLRGVYFSSGTQDGTPIDRLMSSVSSTFGFSRESSQSAFQQGRSYFLSRLFKEVIFPESELVGSNARYELIVKWGQRAAIVGMAAVTIAVLLVWSGSITRHKMFMGDVEQYVAEFDAENKRITNNRDIRTVLPALNALAKASVVYDQEKHPWLSSIGLYDPNVDVKANKAYDTQLLNLFLPRLLQIMEAELVKGNDGGDLYNTFRLYMMFNKLEYMEKEQVKDWFKQYWSFQYQGEATRRQELVAHLDNLMELDFEPVILSKRIVQNTRALMLKVPVAQRVYLRIKSDPVLMQEVNLLSMLGESARTAFKLDEQAQTALKIPYIYTMEGYKSIDFSPESQFLGDVVNERWMLDDDDSKQVDFVKEDLGDLGERVKDLYFADYIFQWRQLLLSMNIVDFTSLRQSSDVLMGVTDPVYSPLRTLLQLVADNTELTPPVDALDKAGEQNAPSKLKKLQKGAKLLSSAQKFRPTTKVDKYFKDIHDLMRETPQGTPVDVWLQRVQQVQEFTTEVSMAPEPGRKAFEIAQARYQNQASNPITVVKGYASSAPQPLEGWLNTMADQSWRVIMGSANGYVSQQWRNQVYEPYTLGLSGRYPLNRRASDELAMYDFIEFFKFDGTLDKFFKTYVEPFVNTKQWHNRVVDNYSMGFSSSSLQQLRRGRAIRDIFFKSNPEIPTIQLDLRPYYMNKQDARFTLDMGNEQYNYSHGPKFWKAFTWSGGGDSNRIRVVFEDLDGVLHQKTYHGPWAWFRIMDSSSVEKTNKSNVYRITFVAAKPGAPAGKERRITYEGRAKSFNNPFNNSLLSSFRAPESL